MLILLPFAAIAIILPVLLTISASDVRTDVRYIAMYLMLGLAWTAIGTNSLRLAGIQVADVTERRNPGALAVMAGGTLAFACAYAGGNVGDGPGWWVVLFAAAGASVVVWLVLALEQFTVGVIDRVLVDRDFGVALRLSGALMAAGVVAGRGAAGTWTTAANAVTDLVAVSWPVLGLIAVDAIVTIVTRGERSMSMTLGDFLIGAIYLGAAIAYVAWLGVPP